MSSAHNLQGRTDKASKCAVLMKSSQGARSLPVLVPRPAHPFLTLAFKSPLRSKKPVFTSFTSPNQSLSITGSRVHSHLRRYHPFLSHQQSEGGFKPVDNSMSELHKTIVLMKDHAIDTEIDDLTPHPARGPLVQSYQLIHRSASKPNIRHILFREYH